MTATVSAPATVARARQLLHSSAEASKQLEENVRELVTMRAWNVLGYENFSEMWEKENGFKCPVAVKSIAVDVFLEEGMNTSHRSQPPNGHTGAEVARAIGYRTTPRGDRARDQAPVISTFKMQRDHGVPAEQRIPGPAHAVRENVAMYGTREYQPKGRGRPRRLGKLPDEMVNEGFNLPRRDADAIDEIARKAAVPKSEIYRQAVAEYLARYRASRPERAS